MPPRLCCGHPVDFRLAGAGFRVATRACVRLIRALCHGSLIPLRTDPFSSEPGSQPQLGGTSTGERDHLGTRRGELFCLPRLCNSAHRQPHGHLSRCGRAVLSDVDQDGAGVLGGVAWKRPDPPPRTRATSPACRPRYKEERGCGSSSATRSEDLIICYSQATGCADWKAAGK